MNTMLSAWEVWPINTGPDLSISVCWQIYWRIDLSANGLVPHALMMMTWWLTNHVNAYFETHHPFLQSWRLCTVFLNNKLDIAYLQAHWQLCQKPSGTSWTQACTCCLLRDESRPRWAEDVWDIHYYHNSCMNKTAYFIKSCRSDHTRFTYSVPSITVHSNQLQCLMWPKYLLHIQSAVYEQTFFIVSILQNVSAVFFLFQDIVRHLC